MNYEKMWKDLKKESNKYVYAHKELNNGETLTDMMNVIEEIQPIEDKRMENYRELILVSICVVWILFSVYYCYVLWNG